MRTLYFFRDPSPRSAPAGGNRLAVREWVSSMIYGFGTVAIVKEGSIRSMVVSTSRIATMNAWERGHVKSRSYDS